MSTLKLQPRRRHIAAGITIALTTAFIALVVLAVGLLGQATRSQTEEQLRGIDVLVQGPTFADSSDGSEDVDDAAAQAAAAMRPDALAETPGVSTAFYAPMYPYAVIIAPGEDAAPSPFDTPGAFSTYTAVRPGEDYHLIEGTMPSTPTDLVIDSTTAEKNDLAVGDTLRLHSGTSGEVLEFTVSGIRQSPLWQLFNPLGDLLVSDAGVSALEAAPAGSDAASMYPTPVGLQLADGVSADDVVADLEEKGLVASTATQLREDSEMMTFAMIASISSLLAAFVLIAVITSVLVVSNSFAVTMAQRRRSFALARALGATRGQAMAAVIRDALLVGIAGSVAGVLLGYLLYWCLLVAGHEFLSSAYPTIPSLNVLAIVLPILVGGVLALAASIAPALGALRVSPLEALRPAEAGTGRALSRLRAGLALAAMVAGAAFLVLAVVLASGLEMEDSPMIPMLAGMAGGLLTLVGLILLLPALVGPIARLFGAVVGPLGKTPARFAALNAARQPRRTATTMSALIIGTALMAMMATGASTAERSITDDLTNRKPVDVIISGYDLPAELTTQVGAVEGIDAAYAVESAEVPMEGHGPMTVFAPAGEDLRAVATRASIADTVEDDTITMGADRAESFGLADGDTLTLPSTSSTEGTLTVKVEGELDMSLTTPATLESLQVEHTDAVFAKLADPNSEERSGLTSSQVVSNVQVLTQGFGPEQITMQSYEGAEREMYQQIITVMLTATIVLLAIAVIVALVGVANTLSLSVVERSGENALLRALGTSRLQIQAMLAWEGAFIATAGAVFGIVLGSLVGLVGVRSVMPSIIPFQISLPWPMLAAVFVLALVAGLLASVLPGRSASKAQPAAALAQRDE